MGQHTQLNMQESMQILRHALGADGSAMAVIHRTLGRMDVAEAILALVDKRNKASLLVPTRVLGDCCDDVYRAHCCELVRRLVQGEDTRPATKAEVLCGLMATSLLSPLAAPGAALADWLGRQVLDMKFDYDSVPEYYEGQVEYDFGVMQRRLAVADRNPSGSTLEVA